MESANTLAAIQNLGCPTTAGAGGSGLACACFFACEFADRLGISIKKGPGRTQGLFEFQMVDSRLGMATTEAEATDASQTEERHRRRLRNERIDVRSRLRSE